MSPRAALRLESLGFTEVYDYVPGKVDWFAAGLGRNGEKASMPFAGDIAQEVSTCNVRTSVADVQSSPSHSGGCVAVNDEGIVMGFLSSDDQLKTDNEATVEQAMTPGPTTVRASEPVSNLAERMTEAGAPAVLVTTPEGRLIGLVRRNEAKHVADQET